MFVANKPASVGNAVSINSALRRYAMRKILLHLLKAYKYLLSPLLPDTCRFTPTCSEYSAEAIEKYGVLKGFYLAVRRVLRCHPFHSGGYDPVR